MTAKLHVPGCDGRAPNVVVTGGSAGLGRATAVEFAKHGCNVAVIARDPGRLDDARRDIETEGVRALTFPVDVSDAQAVEAAADTVAGEWGCIDVWVNCAMATVFAPFAEIQPDEFRRVAEVTFLGFVYGTMAALKHMRPRNHGTIVQVGSALSYRAIPLQSAYCASKFAIRGFTDSLRSELLHDHSLIRITMVQMPAFNTPQFNWARNHMPRKPMPVPPIFQPEFGARAILRAAAHAPRELWVGKPAIQAIVGNFIAPGWIDRFLARSGYEGQLSPENSDPGAPDNLFTPVKGDFGAHGRFDGQTSPAGWITASGGAVRRFIGGAALAGIAALLATAALVRRK
ncbi:MAG TPA: SDR family oxidoreductase [Micropepsaceae bacterium]|nr:SDR family oxidoreductase [Micropepsaceae bacterium]